MIAVAASDDADQGLSDDDHGAYQRREHHGDDRSPEADRLPYHLSMLSPTPAGEGNPPSAAETDKLTPCPMATLGPDS